MQFTNGNTTSLQLVQQLSTSVQSSLDDVDERNLAYTLEILNVSKQSVGSHVLPWLEKFEGTMISVHRFGTLLRFWVKGIDS